MKTEDEWKKVEIKVLENGEVVIKGLSEETLKEFKKRKKFYSFLVSSGLIISYKKIPVMQQVEYVDEDEDYGDEQTYSGKDKKDDWRMYR